VWDIVEIDGLIQGCCRDHDLEEHHNDRADIGFVEESNGYLDFVLSILGEMVK
jgi:hypothetical protein